MKSHVQPHSLPNAIEGLLNWCLPESVKEPILGDCLEGYINKYHRGATFAKLWLIKQVCSLVFHYSYTTQRGTLMFLFSVILVLLTMIMAFVLSGDWSNFINIPSMIIVVVPTLIAGALSAGRDNIRHHLLMLFDNKLLQANKTPKEVIKTYDVMSNTAMIMAWFGVVSGLVAMANAITKENFADVVLPAFAICILTLLYGLMIKTYCYFAKVRINSAL